MAKSVQDILNLIEENHIQIAAIPHPVEFEKYYNL